MILQQITSDNNILTRKKQIFEKQIKSLRINSACIRKNSTKYALFSNERIKITNEQEQEQADPKLRSPKIKYKFQTPNPISYMHQIDKKLEQQEEKDIRQQSQSKISLLKKKDLKDFNSTKKKFFNQYKQNLREYFSECKVYERLFFKHYYQQEKEYFIPKLAWNHIYQKPNEADQYQNQVLKKIIMEEEQKKKQQKKEKTISKKILQIKEEDRQERQYKKELLEKFLAGEQIYFDKLTHIAKKSGKTFENKLILKDTYHFDNILNPEHQFVSYKDLNYQREQLIEFESKQQSCIDSKLAASSKDNDEQAEDQFQEQQIQTQGNEDNLEIILLPSQKQSQIQSQNQSQKQLKSIYPDMNDLKEEEIKKFWLYVRTNQKQKVKFAVLIEPRFLLLQDKNGMTPLHWSILRDYTSLSNFFIQKKLNLYQEDKKGRTPRDIAFERNNVKLKQLIKHLELSNFYMNNKQSIQEQIMITESDDEVKQ